MTEIIVPVSVGEALDKYSILIIKQAEIKDPSRLKDINKEVRTIYPYISDHLNKYKYHYECLKYVNKKIWDLSDLIRSPLVEQDNKNRMYTETFSWNDSRYRIKSKLNKLLASSLNEQKSYSTRGVKVPSLSHICNYTFYSLHIRYLAIKYDLVNILCPLECKNEVEDMFKDDPHILVGESDVAGLEEIDLNFVDVPTDFMMLERSPTEKSINYLVGGRLGDLVHLLYVVMCKYKATGKKGNVYITDDMRYGGDAFSTSAATVLEELGEIVKNQPYIGEFSIFVPGTVEINVNLNEFRHHAILWQFGWLRFLSLIFHTPPILGPWITLKHEHKPEEFVLIHRSISLNRKRQNPAFIPFLGTIAEHNTCKFITSNLAEYDDFPLKEMVPLHKINTLEEFYNEIQKCKFFIGNQSAPLTFAYSIGKPCLCENTEHKFYTDPHRPKETFYWESKNNNYLVGIDKYINIEML